jgi:hypothetical protein
MNANISSSDADSSPPPSAAVPAAPDSPSRHSRASMRFASRMRVSPSGANRSITASSLSTSPKTGADGSAPAGTSSSRRCSAMAAGDG